MKRRILIIGSSGMLGIDLCQELCGQYEAIGADLVQRRKIGTVPEGDCPIFPEATSKFYRCDITKKYDVAEVIKKSEPDIVIHAAAMTDVDGCELDPKKAYKINGEGTKNVALACKENNATLIYISTDFVFDGKKKKPYKEGDKVNPLSTYGDSKLKGEEAVKKVLKKYFILRTSWLYGKNGKNFVDTIIAKRNKEKMLKVVDDQVGSPTYTKDLAKAVHALLGKITGYGLRVTSYGIYHISNSGSVSWYEYAKEILKLAKIPVKVIPISSEELARPAKRPAMSVLDNSKFFKFTGHRTRNWREALADYV